jgi:hypothetical protein
MAGRPLRRALRVLAKDLRTAASSESAPYPQLGDAPPGPLSGPARTCAHPLTRLPRTPHIPIP